MPNSYQIRDQTKSLFDSLISSLLSIATSITWPKIQGIRSKKGNLGRADALKAFFWRGGTYYRLVRNQLSRGQGYP